MDLNDKLDSYNYELPESLIAQTPSRDRDKSRLMILKRDCGEIETASFNDILRYLPENSLLAVNKRKVTPARLIGRRATGGKVEFLLLTPISLISPRMEAGWKTALVKGLIKSSKKVGIDEKIMFSPELAVTLKERGEFGRCEAILAWKGELAGALDKIGHVPLPPYIKRGDAAEDKTRYQTIYADDDSPGSVAAPTAGLHFTPSLKQELMNLGMSWAEICLFVGYGTFSPVRAKNIKNHEMHAEHAIIDNITADRINRAKKENRKLVAVGTTTVRTLEGTSDSRGKITPYDGLVNTFIRPGYQFKAVDAMITNFHLPKSSLLIMVSAFAGRELILRAYERAVREKFRFFSYGDAMLIL